MAFLHSSVFSCLAFVVLTFTLLYTPQGYERDTESRHVVSVHSLLPSSACSSSKDSNTSRLKLVHRHGPCSPISTSREPSHVQLLDEDEARVHLLHHRISIATSGSDNTSSSLAATIPAYTGVALGTGNYIVTVGFGTPKRDLTVVFDTGSDLTWIQCKPCSSGGCYTQQEPLFDPSKSSTYSKIPCGSSECSLLESSTCSTATPSACRYDVEYGDNSQSGGYFSRDTLTLTSSELVSGFMFGCGDDNSGLFGTAAGLLGLGRGKVSLVSQAKKYGGVFSYCLPAPSSSAGYLTFGGGGGGATSKVKFTPMLSVSNMPSFYFVSLLAIRVGGTQLRISPRVFSAGGTLLDSGTVITRLPPSAYAALRSRFRQLMRKYKTAPALSILDTCYDFTGYETVQVPTVQLVFGGGASLSVDLSGILYVAKMSQACLAFAGNGDVGDVTIIGNVQQRRFNVVYDIAKKQIGFGAKGC
ncbi:aspartyl protease family protein At5g10770 [Elaeis guineensis]|uniref:Aspartyl protease family protein At5g10770 n=1 Tax=Elaeis guineensis var. tenera TaxID=51953 RepID=A0A6I9RKY6_ELAGV|nr:aspartyl protease family protein At5g10770 [Elaeis guineensis]